MAKTLRVHHLAKELGVASKEIIAKCNAEGVEPQMKNHMAAVSIGLAESIREWFSVGADVTTIEVASPVDLEKVQKPQLRKVAAEGEAAPTQSDDVAGDEAVGTAVAAPPAEPAPSEAALTVEALTPVVEQVDVGTPQPEPAVPDVMEKAASAAPEVAEPDVEPPAIEAPTEQLTQPEVPPAAPLPAQIPVPLPAQIPVPLRAQIPVPLPPPTPPAPILPAGPQLVPAAAELRGPRVIRIEAPEPVRAPRPRPGPRPAPRPAAFRPATPGQPPPADRAVAGRGRGRGRKGVGDSAARARSPRRRAGSAEISTERLKEWRDQDLIERKERLASATGHGVKARRSAERQRRTGPAVHTARRTEVEITVPIALKDFCAAVGTPFNVVFAKIAEHTGRICKITDIIDADTAELAAMDLGITLKIKHQLTPLEKLEAQFNDRERDDIQPRPPVVAMLGHVDHGKTSLLDAIRRTDVVAGEAGGITQHIGAYQVRHGTWNVTFLDTPGHKAFTAMRARGANLTDVVVLVVAADDGVMPQTVEAINHAKAAGVQIVVALNKIDLPGVDLNKIYAQLAEQELAPVEWGGETDVVKTSATSGEGVDELLTHLSTLSELMNLTADPTVPAQGVVIEARIREGRGVVAQVLIREGTLKVGQVVVCGPGAGRVRTLIDHRGKRMKSAGPGTPVEVVGLDELPEAAERLYVLDSLPEAKRIAGEIKAARREQALAQTRKPQTLEELLSSHAEGEIP